MARIFFIAVLLIAGCRAAEHKHTDVDDLQRYYDTSYCISARGGNYKVSLWANTHLLSVFKPKEKTFLLYNLETNQPVRQVSFARLRKGSTDAFYLPESDLILAYSINHISLYNQKGDLIKKLSLPVLNKKSARINSEIITGPICMNKNSCFVLNTIPDVHIPDAEGRKQYYNNTHLGLFSLRNDSIILADEFGSFPDNIKDTHYGLSYPIITPKNDSIQSYIFKNENVIYEYNTYSGQLTKRKLKKIPEVNLPKFSTDSFGYLSYAKEYDMRGSFYTKFLYDNKNDRYFIFKVMAKDPVNSIGNLSEWKDKPVEIYITDNNYEVVKTVRLKDQQTYFMNYSFIYNGNLFLFRRINDNEQPITIDKYVL